MGFNFAASMIKAEKEKADETPKNFVTKIKEDDTFEKRMKPKTAANSKKNSEIALGGLGQVP